MTRGRGDADVAAGALAALDAWEAELSADARTGAPLGPQARWARAMDLLGQFAQCHRTHRNQPLDLSAPWLRAIYEDDHRDVVIRKSVQCGVSEYLIVRALAEAAAGRDVIHVFPDYGLRNRFVAKRVDRPLRFVAEYRELAQIAIGEAASRSLKLFGDGALFYLGSNAPAQFVEIAADTAIVDEVDQCDPENLILLPDRLSAEGGLPAWIRAGNPTHAGFGIAAAYEDSDQGVWEVRCGGCRKWQRVDWFEHVVIAERDDEGVIVGHRLRDEGWTPESGRPLRAMCAGCGKPLDHLTWERDRCRWRFGQPGHPRRGRAISKLMTRQATLAELHAVFCDALGDATKLARFINNDLGLPWSPPGSAVTEAILDACRAADAAQSRDSRGPCTAGIDVGRVLDVRVSDAPQAGVRRSRWIGRMPVTVGAVVDLLVRHSVRCCVIDAQPEAHFCRALLAALGRQGVRRHGVWLCRFGGPAQAAREPSLDHEERIATVDRTQLLDAALARLRQRRNRLPPNARDLLDGAYYAQMQAPKRVLREGAPGGPRYVWQETGPDHARLADAYDELAAQIGRPALAAASGAGGAGLRTPGAELFADERVQW